MRLVRLALHNWRGVRAREVTFAPGVTVLEGPNEIGKSTIVEAVQMLFNELDSAKKKGVKAVQPVGEDVGSRVEVELEAGEHRFIYAKTFNKSAATTLDILAPQRRQVTGRQAHEAVQQILAQSVDLALWDALLVDQGEKIAPVNLQASSGLARALDEAAGTSSLDEQDTDLFSAVQAEYEKYFTLKTGKSKSTREQGEFDAATLALSEASAALAAIEADSMRFEQTSKEVRRLQALSPKLERNVAEHESTWQSVRSLQQRIEGKRNELIAAQSLQQNVLAAQQQRSALIDELAGARDKLAAVAADQAPLRTASEELGQRLAQARAAFDEQRRAASAAQTALRLANDDWSYLHDQQSVAREEARTEELRDISEQLRAKLAISTALRVDDDAVKQFREADRQLAIARGARDSAATTVAITARQAMSVQVGDESIVLDIGGKHERVAASPLTLVLPGVAEFDIVPPRSAAESQQRAEEAQARLDALAAQFDVADLQAAELANQRRIDAQGEISRLRTRESQVLGESSRDELAATLAALRARCERYLAQRDPATAMPATVAEAEHRVDDAREASNDAEKAQQALHEQVQRLHDEHQQKDAQWRQAEQHLAGLTAAVGAKDEALARDRKAHADELLEQRLETANADVASRADELEGLENELAAASPDAAESLLSNARAVRERTLNDLQQQQQDLAVLNDRLQSAKADGRFESRVRAEQELQRSRAALDAVQRRSACAALLWETLNEHRAKAREAYVRPLKQAIERLGVIVFGAGFEVAIGDDWSLISRTLHGRTLLFDDLSVGAREQLGILTRLAAAQIVSTHGGVPLIIDDALGFSDPSRLETMGAAIAAAGKQCQIIILTCTPGRFTNVGNAQVVRLKVDAGAPAETATSDEP